MDSEQNLYGVGGRTAVGVRAPTPGNEGAVRDQGRVGLLALGARLGQAL